MPNYEYRCTNCENLFEIWQEVGAEAPPCPACEAEVKKVFHPIRTIYKGGGFYVTDLRAEKEKSKAPAKSETPKTEIPSESAKPESPKVESKSENKGESKAAPSTPSAGTAN